MQNQPKYRIQAVEGMTGIPTGTLRAWERRYGVPKPGRSGNRYRLYSEDDVSAVRTMARLCTDGLAPSEAARVVKEKLDAGEPLAPPTGVVEWAVPPNDDSPWASATQALVDAGLAFDTSRMQAVLQRVLLMGPAAQIYEQAFAPALRTLGDRWANGTSGVGEEHFVTRAIAAALHGLVTTGQPADGRRRLLLACVDQEQHALPLEGVALYAVQRGWRTTSLGATTPPEALAAAVDRQKPDAVGLSMIAPHEGSDEALVEAYAAACGTVPWIVGGPAAQALGGVIQVRGGVLASDVSDLGPFLAKIDPQGL